MIWALLSAPNALKHPRTRVRTHSLLNTHSLHACPAPRSGGAPSSPRFTSSTTRPWRTCLAAARSRSLRRWTACWEHPTEGGSPKPEAINLLIASDGCKLPRIAKGKSKLFWLGIFRLWARARWCLALVWGAPVLYFLLCYFCSVTSLRPCVCAPASSALPCTSCMVVGGKHGCVRD